MLNAIQWSSLLSDTRYTSCYFRSVFALLLFRIYPWDFFNFETWLSFLMILVPQNSETSFTLFATCIMIYCLTSRDKIKSVLLINHFHPKFIPSTVNIKKKACFKEYLNRKINLNENVLF